MVDKASMQGFRTWVEASEYMLSENRKAASELAEWYQLAPPEFKREVETGKHCLREGWIIKNQPSLCSKLQVEVVTNNFHSKL